MQLLNRDLMADASRVPGQRHKRSLVAVLLAAMMILTAVVCSYDSRKKLFWDDEAATVFVIEGYEASPRINPFKEFANGRAYGRRELMDRFDVRRQPKLSFKAPFVSLMHDAKHVPLYYFAAHLWSRLFGSGIAGLRSLSIVFAVLQIPAIYWLCTELFESRKTGLIAALLLSVSSFHLVYAQEARPYSLWALLVMVSSALLMVAMRRRDVPSWSAYCVALILTLYTQLFSVFVAIAHLLFCLITERFQLSGNVRRFLVCLGIVLVTLVPWIVAGVSCGGFENASDHFTALKVSPARFSSSWSNNLCWLYLCHRDCSYSGLVVALEMGALFSLLLPVAKKPRIFLLALISCSVLPLLIPDLVCGGQRSTVARYLTPALVGLSAAVAALFSRGLSAGHKAVRYTTVVCLLLLLIGQVHSCWLYYARTDDGFAIEGLRVTVRELRKMDKPTLVIRPLACTRELALIICARDDTRFVFPADSAAPELPRGVNEALLWDWSTGDSKELLQHHAQEYCLTSVTPQLWRLARSGAQR